MFGLQKKESRTLTYFCLAWNPAQILCLPASTSSQVALQIRKGMGLGILENLEFWLTPQDLMKSCDSQGETNSMVKVKKKKICIFACKLMMITVLELQERAPQTAI